MQEYNVSGSYTLWKYNFVNNGWEKFVTTEAYSLSGLLKTLKIVYPNMMILISDEMPTVKVSFG